LNGEYFHVRQGDVRGDSLILRDEEFSHCIRVLRKKPGDHIWVSDGDDTMFEVMITKVRKDSVEGTILGTTMRHGEPKVDITLALSLLKNPSRVEVVVEKATELGVRSIIPLHCERTIPRHERHERLEKIALAAMKQCGRSHLPSIYALTDFRALVEHAGEYSLRLLPHEKTEQSHFLGSVLAHHAKAKSVLVAIGPEGGFSEQELESAIARGFVPVSLGPRRLRSDTAAISALSWIVGEW